MNMLSQINPRWARYGGALISIALITLLLEPFRETINTATVALSFLLLILFVQIKLREPSELEHSMKLLANMAIAEGVPPEKV